VYCMLYRKGVNDTTVVSPIAPSTSDVLDLWSVQFRPVVAGTLVQEPLAIKSSGSTRDVKVMRKLDQDEGIWLSMACLRLGVPTSVGAFARAFGIYSLLWSRTKR